MITVAAADGTHELHVRV